jgi:ubiquitin C-terminal hydrolase
MTWRIYLRFGVITGVSMCVVVQQYFTPELLAGSNAYRPNTALGPQRALKGLALVTAPPVLMIHLKRFTFDFATMRRIKINSVRSLQQARPGALLFCFCFFVCLI